MLLSADAAALAADDDSKTSDDFRFPLPVILSSPRRQLAHLICLPPNRLLSSGLSNWQFEAAAWPRRGGAGWAALAVWLARTGKPAAAAGAHWLRWPSHLLLNSWPATCAHELSPTELGGRRDSLFLSRALSLAPLANSLLSLVGLAR